MEAAILPEEILSLICAELGTDRDFDTLFNCALSSKSLADAALRTLYQHQELSPAFQQNEEDVRQKGDTINDKFVIVDQYFRKWTILWRSIIASAMDVTYKPYCRYLRILDFRNFLELVENNSFKFNANVKRSFYAKPLTKFQHNKQEGNRQVVDVIPTINQIGETVVPKASLLEEISGWLQASFLSRWVAQTPRLRNMVLYSGDALSGDAGRAIAEHCEHFSRLTIHHWLKDDADAVFEEFLLALQPDTLQSFELIGSASIARKSFEALGRHSGLKVLKLEGLCKEAMENLNGLKQCTNIHTLALEDSTRSTQLEALNNDVFVDVVEWLSSCTKLRDVSIKNLFDGPTILAKVASHPDVQWTKLNLEGYTVRFAASAFFHSAIAEQKGLRVLGLKGNGDDTMPADLNIMVESICQLTELRDLQLKDVSDEFDEDHIRMIALSLPELEEFYTSGGEISSDILLALAQPKKLKSLTLLALTQFDADSILEFLGRLDPNTQQGFHLSLMAVDALYIPQDEEAEIVRDFIRTKLNGRFGTSKAYTVGWSVISNELILRNGRWKRVVKMLT